MSIKHFILIPLALSATALVLVLALNGTVLRSSLERIDREHQMNVQGTVKSLLDSYRLRLSVLSKEYEKHNDLGEKFGSFAVTGKPEKLQKSLETIAVDSDVDFSNMLDMHGDISAFTIEQTLREEIQKVSKGASSGIFIRLYQGRVALMSYSPVYLFGEQEGILLIGYFVESTLLAEIRKSTSAQVELVDSPSGNIPLEQAYSLNVESGSIRSEEQRVFSVAVIVGISGFLLLSFGMYWLLSKAFGTSFEKVLKSFRQVVKGIEEDAIIAPEPARHPIREINDIHGAFRKTVQSLVEFQTRLHKRERDRAFVEVAEEVLHDLRAPMKALDKQMKSQNLSDGIKDTFNRVQKIMHVLRKEKRIKELGTSFPETAKTLELLPVILDMLVDEKMDQYSDREIDISFEPSSDHVLAYCEMDRVAIERAVSNLIDNAAEAVETAGQVTICVKVENKYIQVTISDNGKGISSEVIPRISERGYTAGKENGSGLGLWYANKVVDEHGGLLTVESRVGHGTSVSIEIPRAQTPNWAAPKINIPESGLVAILDDDDSVHHLWAECLGDFAKELLHFHEAEEYLAWANANPELQHLLLCDFQIHGSALNGLDCIKKSDATHKHLVTEFYGREDIIDTCRALGVSIIPKPVAHLVPVEVASKGTQGVVG